MLLLLQLGSMHLLKAYLCSQRELQRKQEIKQNTYQLCYAQPIQARLIPECKDSIFALLHFTSLTQGCPTRGTRAKHVKCGTYSEFRLNWWEKNSIFFSDFAIYKLLIRHSGVNEFDWNVNVIFLEGFLKSKHRSLVVKLYISRNIF